MKDVTPALTPFASTRIANTSTATKKPTTAMATPLNNMPAKGAAKYFTLITSL